MPDWVQYVRQHLRLESLAPEREAEIVEDLARQLDDAYRDALARGDSEQQAATYTRAQIPNWESFAVELRQAERRHRQSHIDKWSDRADQAVARKGGHWIMFADLRRDLLYGIRMLRKNPGFTAVAVLTLALGIGATAAIFSVANALFFRPLPVKDPEQLTMLTVTHSNSQPRALSYLDYLDYRSQSDAFSDMTGYGMDLIGLSTPDWADRVIVSFVPGNFFSMLGVSPALGRTFLPEEGAQTGADPIMVLGHQFWQRRFGGDPAVVGMPVMVNGTPFTIVGVAAEGFDGPYMAVEMEAYLPVGMMGVSNDYRTDLETRDAHRLRVLARLKPGTSLAEAQASLDVIARRLEAQYPETNREIQVRVRPETRVRPDPENADQVPGPVEVFLALVGLVLLVACFNVANLLMVRATVRHKELAIRAALGAGRTRLFRQLLTESLLLGALGGLAGLLVAQWGARVLSSIRVPGVPARFDFSLDWRVFAFSAAVALATGVVAGILPALRASKADVNTALREGGRSPAGSTGRHRLRNTLVVAQVAGSLVLLIAAGLFLRSFRAARQLDLGFDPKQVMLFSTDPEQYGYDDVRGRAFYRDLVSRVQSLPGVVSATHSSSVPLGYGSRSTGVVAEGQVLAPDQEPLRTGYNIVDRNYFQTLRTPLLQGRTFSTEYTQSSRPVAVINRTMARRFWPGENPLGMRFSRSGPEGPFLEVVGVVGDGKYFLFWEQPQEFFYVPFAQNYSSQQTLQVRTTARPEDVTAAVRSEFRALDPTLPVFNTMTMEESLQGGNGFLLVNVGASLASVLGLLGLLLASVGLYSVVSYTASARTHEIGIRLALGAQPRDILKLVVRQGLLLVLVGVTLGLAGAFALTRFLASLLFGVSAHDPFAFVATPLLLVAVALVACYVPARRATKVDPMVALRTE